MPPAAPLTVPVWQPLVVVQFSKSPVFPSVGSTSIAEGAVEADRAVAGDREAIDPAVAVVGDEDAALRVDRHAERDG